VNVLHSICQQIGKCSSGHETGKFEGKRRRGKERMGWLYGITNSIDMSLGKFQDFVMDRKVCCAVVHGVAKSQTQLSD